MSHHHFYNTTQIPSHLSHVSTSKFIAALADVTHSELQPYMLNLIQAHGSVVGCYQPGSSAGVENDMQEAMDLVWRTVVGLDGGGMRANDNQTADVL
jgi:hypothetical protein